MRILSDPDDCCHGRNLSGNRLSTCCESDGNMLFESLVGLTTKKNSNVEFDAWE